MGQTCAPVGDPGAGSAPVTECEVFLATGRAPREAPNDILAVAFVPAFPHAHEVGVDADPQTTPRPRIRAGSVRSRILASSSSDHSRMYWASSAITSSKSTVSPLRRTCHRPVMPGLAPRRLK